MSLTTRGRKTVALALGGLALATISGYVGGASAATTTTYSADCAARLLYLELGGTEIPLYDGTSGCNQDDSIIGALDLAPLPVQADLLYQRTTGSGAEAGVAHVLLPLDAASGGQLPDITVDLLTSKASCSQGEPSGSSHVVRVEVAGYGSLEIPQDLMLPDVIDLSPLPLIIKMNQQENTATSSTSTTTTNGVTTTRTVTTKSLTQTALEVLAPGIADVVVARSHVDCTKTVTETTDTPPPPPPPPSDVVGWMSGGGQLNADLTHSLTLPCTKTQAHPKPKLNVETPNGRFTLDSLDSVSCTMDSNQGSPEQPDAGFNTLTGSGKGSCNGKKNVPVSFRFTDEGEPNKGADEASITIGGNACPVNATGTVNGNQQAHRSNNPPA
jgi:hypothetical protein